MRPYILPGPSSPTTITFRNYGILRKALPEVELCFTVLGFLSLSSQWK